MTRIFVTGTDTGVGKTVASAVLVRALNADYWKPVQTGIEQDSDTRDVITLTGCECFPETHALPRPLSPHLSARLAGVRIALDDFVLPETARPLVVEGAGGLLVPLNDTALMTDLIARLGLPLVLVSRAGLGTINHTLLSLEAARTRGLRVLGVMMNGPANAENRAAIEHYGRVPVLAELEPADPLDAAWVARMADRFDTTSLEA